MIPSDEIRVRELVRREMDARMRSPILNSQMSPRGVTQGRVAKRLVTNLPAVAQEFDEVNLEQSDGSVIPFLFKGGSWTPLGGEYISYGGLYVRKGDFKKITTIWSNAAGALPFDSAFTKEFDDSTLQIFIAGSVFHNTGTAVIGVDLQIDGVTVCDSKRFTNEGGTHKTLIPRWVTFPDTLLGTSAISAGAHDVDLVAKSGTQSDSNDFFEVVFVESYAETT